MRKTWIALALPLTFLFVASRADATAGSGSGSAITASADAGVAPVADAGVAPVADAGVAPVADAGAVAALPDAGAVVGSGSSGSVSSGGTTGPDAGLGSGVADPATDLGTFLGQVKDAQSHCWGLEVLVLLVGAAEALSFLGKSAGIAALAFLGKGRVSIVLGAAGAVGTVAVAAYLKSASWSAAIVAAGGALLLYVHPAATGIRQG
jgi:hypothetical protein